MKLKLTYRRRSGDVEDIVVTTDAAAMVSEVAREILEADPKGSETAPDSSTHTLKVAEPGAQAVTLPADRAIGEAPIASGYEVEVVADAAAPVRGGADAAVAQIVGGPGAGKQFRLPAGVTVVGRNASADLVLDDPYVSQQHARIEVANTIEIVDLNSANGIVVDGAVVTRVTLVPGQRVQIGETVLQFTLLTVSPDVAFKSVTGGAIPFDRSPRVEPRYPFQEHSRPKVPAEPTPPMFSPLLLIGPIVMGLAMFSMTGRPLSLLMITMAPVMAVVNNLNKNKQQRNKEETEVGKFLLQLEVLEEELQRELPYEASVRKAEAPPATAIYQSALDRTSLLWSRRPEHWSFLTVRLGTAALLSRNSIAAGADDDDGIPSYTRMLRELEERYRMVEGVPVLESGLTAGGIGVVGTTYGPDALRGLLVQLAGLHSPAELVITALTSPDEQADLDFLRWLPHTSSPQSPLTVPHLADTQGTVGHIIAELEHLVSQRIRSADEDKPPTPLGPLEGRLVATSAGASLGDVTAIVDETPPVPIVVVVVTEQAPIDRARLVQLAERGHQVGIVLLHAASRAEALPPVCRTFIDVSEDLAHGQAHFVRHGAVVRPLAVAGVSADHAKRFALALAPLFDSGAVVDDASDLPRQVSLLSLLGPELADSSAAVVERWQQNQSVHDRDAPPKPRRRPGSLRAIVGSAGVDSLHLDLRTQGPHALVGGTTGAGKSEFLQAWVLGMAAEYSPDRVTFLFVDYKGGAAFAECTRLPHCVGLVTDLSPHLVRRALTSLRAELHHREHLLNRKKAKDLLELEKRGDPEAPPALVLVIDEFAALSKEVPEFVDGVVDIAQRGRSLGIHLIMATQRPAGVIKDNLRANTNLRIALRMADESDSHDVIETEEAAHFDPSIPGRAVAKSGPGRLTPFQSAYAGGHTTAEADPVSVSIAELRFGPEVPWAKDEPSVEPEAEDLGPTDLIRMVESVIGAAGLAEVPDPRKPWLEELSSAYDLALLGPRTDRELILGVVDLPERQAQEVVHFRPDLDGNLAIYGTGGTGKTVLLRTLANGAGITPRGGPVHVYCLDFAAGGLRMLEPLPHVGSVISGDDQERVARLIRELRALADERSRTYPEANAGSIEEYRTLTDKPDEPRVLVLLDNLEAFRDAYQHQGNKGQLWDAFEQLLGEGRALGIHFVVTADRPSAVSGSVASSLPRRVVLRMSDKHAYLSLNAPNDILDDTSPPGRAIIDGVESQVAVLGGSGNAADQAQAIKRLARSIERAGRAPAPPVQSLPTEVLLSELPAQVQDQPLLGLSDQTLGPVGIEPRGTLVIGGGPGSGRSNALLVLAQALRRWKPDIALVYLGVRRSMLPDQLDWDLIGTTIPQISDLAAQLSERIQSDEPMRHTAVFVEAVSELSQTPAEKPLAELIKVMRNSDHLIVGESETSTLTSVFPLFKEFRTSRRFLLLQPDWMEAESITKTPFGKVRKTDFPVGRGMLTTSGRLTKVHLPLADAAALGSVAWTEPGEAAPEADGETSPLQEPDTDPSLEHTTTR